jgi:hypothetical protein
MTEASEKQLCRNSSHPRPLKILNAYRLSEVKLAPLMQRQGLNFPSSSASGRALSHPLSLPASRLVLRIHVS